MSYQIVSWLKKNQLTSLIIAGLAILLILTWSAKTPILPGTGVSEPGISDGVIGRDAGSGGELGGQVTIKESTLSLVVKDVRTQADAVVKYAEDQGGFMVSTSLDSPEESPLATIVVRVPVAKLQAAVDYYRALATKVSSESITGVDVTDEYKDLNKRITTLEETIDQLEAIKARATKISDLLTITQQIILLQEQIDSLKGQKNFIDQAAKFSKITVYLATDELSLPYQPTEGFRPGVVLKLAVRSLLGNIYALGRGLIWVAVYGVVVVPLTALVWYLLKRFKVI